jgi:hypothetical protein
MIDPVIRSLSVVRDGVVQRSVTASPTLVAVSPVTISGSFSEGGSGGPGLAHPAKRTAMTAAPAAVTAVIRTVNATGQPASGRLLSKIGIQPEAIAFSESTWWQGRRQKNFTNQAIV